MLNLDSYFSAHKSLPSEIRPFLPALHIILSRLEGLIPPHDTELAFLSELPGMKEEELLVALLQMDFLKHQYQAVNGEFWDIQRESYLDFCARNTEAIIQPLNNNNAVLASFSMWVITLCNWESTALASTQQH